jgi:hypothetical protein
MLVAILTTTAATVVDKEGRSNPPTFPPPQLSFAPLNPTRRPTHRSHTSRSKLSRLDRRGAARPLTGAPPQAAAGLARNGAQLLSRLLSQNCMT